MTQETQRKAAISNLAKTVRKAGIAARGEDLDKAQKALTQQLYRVGEGCRFYQNLGVLDQDIYNRVDRLCLKIEKKFYTKYNPAKGITN